MNHNFHIMYFLWGRDKPAAIGAASEAAVSIMSAKNHMPNVPIAVYIDKKNLSFFMPFVEKYVDQIHDVQLDSRSSLFSKILNFYAAIQRYKCFCFLDSDTIVKMDFSSAFPVGKDIMFASFNSSNGLCLMRDPEFIFFKRNFGITLKANRPNSCAMYINQENKKFWRAMRYTISRIISDFKTKIDKDKSFRGLFMFFDEFYFSIALRRMGVNVKECLLDKKLFSGGKSKCINHKKATFLSKNDPLLLQVRNSWSELGIDPKLFRYSRMVKDA